MYLTSVSCLKAVERVMMREKSQSMSKSIVESIQKNTIINYFIIFYCSFMVCCPPYFTKYVQGYIKTPLRLFGIFFVLIIYFFYVIYKQRISKLFVFTFIMCLYFLIICLINHNDYFYALYSNFFMTLSSIALFEIYTNSDLKEQFIKINYCIWLISIIIFVIVLLTGYENSRKLYSRNLYIVFIIIYILFEKHLLLIYNNKIYNRISYLMSVATVLFSIATGALTASIVLILIYLYVYILNKTDLYKKLFDNFNIYAITLVLFFALLIYPGSYSQLADVVSKLFHKVGGLSGRNIWYDLDRKAFIARPIFGYGPMGNYQKLLGIGHNSPHSFVFQYLLDGGIVGLMMLLSCYKVVINCINRKDSKDIRCYLFLMLFIFTLRNMMEGIGLNYIFFVLSSIYFMYETYDSDYLYLNLRK